MLRAPAHLKEKILGMDGVEVFQRHFMVQTMPDFCKSLNEKNSQENDTQPSTSNKKKKKKKKNAKQTSASQKRSISKRGGESDTSEYNPSKMAIIETNNPPIINSP